MTTDFLSSVLAPDLQQDGTAVSPRRKTINFVGATVTDDPDNFKTTVTVGSAVDRFVTARLVASSALPANSRTGSTLTADAFGALSVDGVAVVDNDVVLVAAEGGGAHAHNGVYTVVQAGSGGTPFILTRDTSFDTADELPSGLRVYVSSGSANAGTEWVLVTTGVITVNTTALDFSSPVAGSVVNLPADPGEDGYIAVGDSGNLTYLATLPLTSLVAPSTTGVMLYANGAAWAETTTVKSNGTTLSVGATTATTGLFNFGHNATVLRGLTSLGSDVSILRWGTASDLLIIGSNAAGLATRFDIGTGQSYDFRVNNSTEYTFDASLFTLASGNDMAHGANPSSSGAIRLSEQDRINYRSSAGSGASSLNGIDFGFTSTDHIWIGNSSALNLGMGFGVGTSGEFRFQVSAVTEYELNATTFDGNQNTLTDWASIDLGATPATGGAVNLTNNTFVFQKSSGGSSVSVIGISSSDRLKIGTTNAAITACDFDIGSGSFAFSQGGVASAAIGTSALTLNLGGTAAVSGTVRMPAAGTIAWNNGSGTAVTGIQYSTNRLILGQNSTTDGIDYKVATGGFHDFQINGTSEMALSATTLDGAGNTLTDWASISLGATPATGGAINLTNGTTIESASAGGDIQIAIVNGTAMLFGGDSNATETHMRIPTGTSFLVVVAGATEYSFNATTLDGNQNTLTDWASLALGATPAAAGALRLTNNEFIVQRFTDASDNILIGYTNGNVLILGVNEAAHAGVTFRTGTGVQSFTFGGITEYSLSTTTFDGNQNTLTDWASITLGSGTFGTSALVMVPHAVTIVAGPTVLGTSGSLFDWGIIGNDTLRVGNSTTVARLDLAVESAGNIWLLVDGTGEYNFTSAKANFKDNEINFNDTTATGGKINVAHNSVVINGVSSGGGDTGVSVLSWGAANEVIRIGEESNVSGVELRANTSGAISLQLNAVKRIEVNSTGIGFFAAAPVAQQADMTVITIGAGTPNTTTQDVTASHNQTILNDNFADLATQINKVRTALRNLGLMA